MAKSAKAKAPAATVFVPQTRADVTQAIRCIGEHMRERTRIEATMNDRLALIREEFESQAAPHAERIKQLTEGVQIWCEAHRAELTDNGRTKTANLASGEVKWRLSPPKVVIKGAETVIEIFRARGLFGLIRKKEEIDKEAILAEPALVDGIRGVRIEQEELFVVEPFQTQLEDAA
nr:host-nuclease inhibitor Gam family protein [uncultured Rhodopila sp.]